MARRQNLYRSAYRDTSSGRFVSESTWRRSKAHGGKRYKRVRVKTGRKKKILPVPPAPPEEPAEELLEQLGLEEEEYG
jgi:hypothetical protein